MRRLDCLTLITLSASVWAETVPGPQESDAEFHFVVLGDAQFDSPASFNRLIDQTRQLRPAFVIQVGDLIEGYSSDLEAVRAEWRRFKRQIAPLAPVPYYPVPGNHDTYGGNPKPDAALEGLYVSEWGPLYYTFTYKNAQFFALNSDQREHAAGIGGRQLAWLRNALENSAKTHKFVFMHRPPHLMDNRDTLHGLFTRHGVSEVFYGHHHHYHHYQRDGVNYTMTNAGGDMAHDNPVAGGYFQLLQVSVRGAEVDVAPIAADAIRPRDSVHPRDNYDLFALGRRLIPDTVKLAGRSDHHFQWHLPLFNPTERQLDVYVSCASADKRWQFEPAVIEPIRMRAGSSHTIEMTASFAPGRQPESRPHCELRVPLQKVDGRWFDFTTTVVGQR